MEFVELAWINKKFTTVVTPATLAGSSLGGRPSPGTPRPVPCRVAVQRFLEATGTAWLADTISVCGQE